MKKQTWKHFAVASALVGLVTVCPAGAQVEAAKRLPGKRVGSAASQAPTRPSTTPGSPSYTFTLLSYPDSLSTLAYGINKGATSSQMEIVGGYGPGTGSGFLLRVSGTKTVTETYKTVNNPHATQLWASDINDLGQIVGGYVDGSGLTHGYEESGAKFTELNVPFSGAYLTNPLALNNSAAIVGTYNAPDGETYGFTLIGSTYTSINYPGATYTATDGINNNGDISGVYIDTSGVEHGFLLNSGTFTSIDFPGAIATYVGGINDSGDIVGSYCTTSKCTSTYEGMQGFVLSGGIFTTIAIPAEFATIPGDINNDGVIVGYYQDAAGVIEGFLATP